jgi:thiamine phosphate synthase YjbQ (UPF0047 family)
MTYYSILAAQRLGDAERAERLTAELDAFVQQKRTERGSIDYFATSLPTMLIFREDVDETHRDLVAVMDAQLALLRGDRVTAQSMLAELEARDPADALVRDLLAEAEPAVVA